MNAYGFSLLFGRDIYVLRFEHIVWIIRMVVGEESPREINSRGHQPVF